MIRRLLENVFDVPAGECCEKTGKEESVGRKRRASGRLTERERQLLVDQRKPTAMRTAHLRKKFPNNLEEGQENRSEMDGKVNDEKCG